MRSGPLYALRRWYGGPLLVDEPLRRHTTMRVGGPAEAMLRVDHADDLARLVRWCGSQGMAWRFLGRGSNVIAPDQGLDGLTLVPGKGLARITAAPASRDVWRVRAGAGVGLGRLARWCAEQGLTGLEFAEGIPGSLGGGVMMNAGAHGRDMSRVVRSLVCVDQDGALQERLAAELDFSYRRLDGLGRAVVVEVELELERGDREEIRRLHANYRKQRRKTQPLHLPSAGSVFRNPPGDHAGRLIEAAGCKGLARGDAQVSRLHANFIVNRGRARARDVVDLMRQVADRVERMSGIRLQPEVEVLGPARKTA